MSEKLALFGGTPVRIATLPYGRQTIDDDDVAAVADVLRSDWLTTGPKVAEFERAFADVANAAEAVAVSSGTAALHAAVEAIGIGPGDEVIVPAMTFAATANCVVFQGGTPVFVDVRPDTLLIDPAHVEAGITPRTKAIIAVDYAGQPCDYDELRRIADRHKIALVADSCHALGANYRGCSVGSLADLTAFSLHPVKHITAGEGGVITTDKAELAQRMRSFRNHGMQIDQQQRAIRGNWFYEIVKLGYNYRLTDLQCALSISQLGKLPSWLRRRQEIARIYRTALARLSPITSLAERTGISHAYHLYVICFDLDRLSADRTTLFRALHAEGIGVQVHYIPVHLHPFYRKHFGTAPGLCPIAEAAYERIVSLPIFPSMSDHDVQDTITAITKVVEAFAT